MQSRLIPLRSSEYARLLAKEKLWPVDPMIEQNWSGRGQHAEFQSNEQHLINNLLVVQENLGSTVTAIVQSVKCRRILLARKAITCGRQTMTKEQAVTEVAHMTRLSHAHILRVIGTYVKGRELSILLYPVAEYNLTTFLEALPQRSGREVPRDNKYSSATHFFPCLSSSVRHIHSTLTKHMDIKPQNILVRLVDSDDKYRVYIADFGIAKSYLTPDAIETDGRTSFTRKYAAPEVVLQDKRGLPADIFSLGCVFLELTNALWPASTEGFDTIIADSGPKSSYEANIDLIQSKYDCPTFIYNNGDEQLLVDLPLIMEMLNRDPKDRPTVEQLCKHFGTRPCCTEGPPALEAMSSSSLNESLEEKISPEVENTTKDYVWKSHGHKGWIASCPVADAGDSERGCTCGHDVKDGDVHSASMRPIWSAFPSI
jgi:serine/threonine protein kinase